MADVGRWLLIWCPNCHTRQPLVVADNDAQSADLVCGTCDYVIATVHQPDPAGKPDA